MNPNSQNQTIHPHTEWVVLLADNDPDFLVTRAEFLENAGYQIITATTLRAAEQALNEARIHLAVLDIRLVDDDDEKDVSGLVLAQTEAYRSIPKIILTGFPSIDAVRSAFRPRNVPPAVEFLAKQDGPDALIEAVNQAFAQHVRINWNLDIKTNERNPLTLIHLVNLIGTDFQGERLLNRADELKDLFRRLFYERNRIRIDRLLWQREGRVALTVLAFKQGASPESLVVVCGLNAKVVDEAHFYRECAPKAAGDTGTALVDTAETAHFAANAYALTGADLENARTLADLYRSGQDKLHSLALSTLCQKTLAAWHQDRRIPDETKTLSELYRQRLGLSEAPISKQPFTERVEALIRQIPALGSRLELISGTLVIRFNGRSVSYPDPTPTLYQISDIERPVILVNAPGTLSGDSVLTDSEGHTWLTDFADAGQVPLLWNFVALEAAIRFDWVDEKNFQWLHGMEQCLVADEFSKLNISDVEPVLRRPVRAIQTLRRLASRTVGKDTRPYHLGILFQAASRLAEFNPIFPLTPNQLARLAHVLLAAAMICDRTTQIPLATGEGDKSEAKAIHLDKENHVVRVEGKRIPLRGHGYNLLCYLYDHANKLCTRRELVEHVFKETYDEQNKQQVSNLNTAVDRLREKLEPDPAEPRYLLTEPGAGYRLAVNPSA